MFDFSFNISLLKLSSSLHMDLCSEKESITSVVRRLVPTQLKSSSGDNVSTVYDISNTDVL